MAGRKYNPNLAKINRSYTVDEIARLFNVHKNTVRAWMKDGLEVCDQKKPALILGRDLREYLQKRRSRNRKRCPPGHIYCVRCHKPRIPKNHVVDYIEYTDTLGCLIGTCPQCYLRIYRRTSILKKAAALGNLKLDSR